MYGWFVSVLTLLLNTLKLDAKVLENTLKSSFEDRQLRVKIDSSKFALNVIEDLEDKVL